MHLAEIAPSVVSARVIRINCMTYLLYIFMRNPPHCMTDDCSVYLIVII